MILDDSVILIDEKTADVICSHCGEGKEVEIPELCPVSVIIETAGYKVISETQAVVCQSCWDILKTKGKESD